MVDGMNYTPTGPNFEEMRDGILQSVAISNPAHECLVWEAFAQYGVGVGARGRVRGSSIIVTESFDVPATCGGP
jgi:extracellular elastinolytic metalloproteinase